MMQSSIVAMVLAGGQGTRLGVLTEDIAKPAVPFGGKYRIIDFALSNCVNSGIYKVGVLTQYKPHKLNTHIGIGRPWDLDRKGGGVTVLQPYTYESGKAWFKGTADAIYENLDYLDKTNPKYVLVLSGDHIYGMDYMDMLTFHISKHAKASCACMNVPLNETYRFGIMVTDISKRIVEFQEKPQQAKSTLASLGIYIFNWDYLRDVLIQDAKNDASSHDFGKDIIPKMVEEKDDLYAFEYEGYWRDVGTIYSFWESNLELIQSIPQLNLYNDSWRFYTRTEEMPPAFFGKEAVSTNSLVSEGCEIHGVLNKSILFQGVQVGKGSIVKDSIILTGAKIGDGVEISNAVIAEDALIGSGAKIGVGDFAENEENPGVYNSQISVIGYHAKVPENAIIGKNCVIHSGVTPESTDDWQVQSGSCIRK